MKPKEIERRVMSMFRSLANEHFRVGALAQSLAVKSEEIADALEASSQFNVDRDGTTPGGWWVSVANAVRCPNCRSLIEGDLGTCDGCGARTKGSSVSERVWTIEELVQNPKLGLSRGTLTKAFEFGRLKKHRGRLEATFSSLDRYLAGIGIQASSVLDEGEAV